MFAGKIRAFKVRIYNEKNLKVSDEIRMDIHLVVGMIRTVFEKSPSCMPNKVRPVGR